MRGPLWRCSCRVVCIVVLFVVCVCDLFLFLQRRVAPDSVCGASSAQFSTSTRRGPNLKKDVFALNYIVFTHTQTVYEYKGNTSTHAQGTDPRVALGAEGSSLEYI